MWEWIAKMGFAKIQGRGCQRGRVEVHQVGGGGDEPLLGSPRWRMDHKALEAGKRGGIDLGLVGRIGSAVPGHAYFFILGHGCHDTVQCGWQAICLYKARWFE